MPYWYKLLDCWVNKKGRNGLTIPFIIGVLVTIGVNPALIAIILGVDRILDMCRTTLNVIGDMTAATYVARSEGYELLKPHEPAIVHAGVPVAERGME